MNDRIGIRCIEPDDDLEKLTDMIHQAYARRIDSQLRFWATYQTVEDTAKRLQSGQGFVALAAEEFIGTITVRPPDSNSEIDLYRRPETWTIIQFAVRPDHQGRGIGRQLHAAVIQHVRNQGGQVIALDTARQATDLVEMYQKWGYVICGEADWRPQTNYVSVVMSKTIS